MIVSQHTLEALKFASQEAGQERFRQENAVRNELYAQLAWVFFGVNVNDRDEAKRKLDKDQERKLREVTDKVTADVYKLVSQTQRAERFAVEAERAEAERA